MLVAANISKQFFFFISIFLFWLFPSHDFLASIFLTENYGELIAIVWRMSLSLEFQWKKNVVSKESMIYSE